MTSESVAALDVLAVVEGIVEEGDKRGGSIGFPTANVKLCPEHASIDDGVYAALVDVFADGTSQRAAVSIGRRPTFYVEGERLLEAHLLDYCSDLYGSNIRVRLISFIRPQCRFDGLDSLVAQLCTDREDCREVLTTLTRSPGQ